MKLEEFKDYMVTHWSTCKLAFVAGIVVGLLIGWITA